MLYGSIFAIAIIAVIIYLKYGPPPKKQSRKQRKNAKKELVNKNGQKTQSRPHSEYHCVETRHQINCCQAVKEIHGKRFLSAEAPTLPLTGCDQPDCKCEYVHHEDRREDSRRLDESLQHELYATNGEQEKRTSGRHGRRTSD